MGLSRRVSFMHATIAGKTGWMKEAIFRFALFLLMISMLGCEDQGGGVVKESDEYSYDDIMAEAAEEELASEAERKE